MRIGRMLGALLDVGRLDQALADVASRGWPCAPGGLSRERALALGYAALAGVPCASVGDTGGLVLAEGIALSDRPGGWLEFYPSASGSPAGVSLACENPLQALGWYRGLGLTGPARRAADDSIIIDLPEAQWLRFADRARVQSPVGWRPLVISFARVDAQGRRPPGLRPRVLAGPEGECIELL